MNNHYFKEYSKEGKKLKLSDEETHIKKIVYKKLYSNKNDKSYEFKELWDPDKKYDGDHIIVPLQSVYGGKEKYGPGMEFANIEGSSHDPLHDTDLDPKDKVKSWVEFLTKHGIDCSRCVTDHHFYNQESGESMRTCPCTTPIFGGHVMKGRQNDSPMWGSSVYLIPICQTHNSSMKHGTGYFMKTENEGYMMILDRYLTL